MLKAGPIVSHVAESKLLALSGMLRLRCDGPLLVKTTCRTEQNDRTFC